MFSVIIPIYNKFPHLDRSITSVLNQKFGDWELILVDDGSTDGSYEKAKSYTDKRIQVFRRNEPGPGGYAARNLGIEKAKYEWVVFLDADDEWMENHLTIFSTLIKIKPTTQIVSSSWLDNFEGGNMERCYPNIYNQSYENKGIHEIDLSLFLQKSIEGKSPFWTGAVGLRTELLRDIDGFPEGRCKRGGDVDTWLRAIFYGKIAIWSPKLTVVYHRDSVNMVTKNQGFELGCEIVTVKKLASISNNKQIKKLLYQFLNARVVSRWLQTLRVGQNPESLWGKVSWRFLTVKGKLIAVFSALPSWITRKLYHLVIGGKYD